MTLSPDVLKRVQQLRARYFPPIGIQQAVLIARAETKDWSDSPYPFLNDFDVYTQDEVSGEVGPFTVEVTMQQDYDSHIGEDDVTGTFYAREYRYSEEIVPENAVACSYAGYNGPRDVKWYVPGNATLQLRDYYIKEGKLGRSQIDDAVRAQIQRDMREDADRSYHGVTVTVLLEDVEMASGALWGIDSLGDDYSASYFREVAADLLDEAIAEAREQLAPVADSLAAKADRIRASLAAL